jgi:predicted amino acid dehydrogenase
MTPTRLDDEWTVVRYPDADGQVVHRLANRPLVPDEMADHPDLVIQSVADASALSDATVNRSGLPQGVQDLLSEHFGVAFD